MSFSITINGRLHEVDATDYSPTTTLNDFIRKETSFRGTKITCGVGGCGACIVALITFGATGSPTVRAVNSCLALLFSLNGASVITNDGLGNSKVGYHAIQSMLAKKNGTQCGYCASGFVMSLYSLLQNNPHPTALEVEQLLDGNICRCTGYRSILDAFKTFSTAEGDLATCLVENCCQKRNVSVDIETCCEPNMTVQRTKLATVSAANRIWHDVSSLPEVSYYMSHYAGLRVMLCVGGTSQGVDKVDYDVYLNIKGVAELGLITQSPNGGIVIGATVAISDVITYLQSATGPNSYSTSHFQQASKHLNRVASHSIRNRASLVGNLVFTHQHQNRDNDFPSDAFIVSMGLGATVQLLDITTNQTSSCSLTQFLSTNLDQRLVVSVTLPWAQQNECFRSYKIAMRQVNAHALVNAAMRVQVDPLSNLVVGTPCLAFGGVATRQQRLARTEAAFIGTNVTNVTQLQAVVTTAIAELQSIVDNSRPRVSFRLAAAMNYFYKLLLTLNPALPNNLQKASQVWFERPVTSASQSFGTNPREYPVSLPIPKVDGEFQTAGEAQYVDDIPLPYGTLFGAVVQATQAGAPILVVDTSAAATVKGFVKFFDASSIPAAQNVFNVGKVFADKKTDFAGQCIGFVVARTEDVARRCAAIIQGTVVYGPAAAIVVSVEQAIASNTVFAQVPPVVVTRGDPDTAMPSCHHIVNGSVRIGSQYHFHMENHGVLVQPVEGAFVIDTCSQCVAAVQATVATVLNIPQSSVVAQCRRCGGGFGAKVTASNFTAAVASIAANDLQKPVKFNMTLEDPQRGLGARPEYLATYTAGITNGRIVALKIDVAIACGYNPSDCEFEQAVFPTNVDNCYFVPNFKATSKLYQTNIAPGTSVRGPGWIQSIAVSEMIMSQIATQLGVSPTVFRMNNLYAENQTTPGGTVIRSDNLSRMWSLMMLKSNWSQRRAAVDAFNSSNTFVKRGLSINPSRFGVSWGGGGFNSLVAIYPDGSICITHGGTEIGQGISTKVAQVCAFQFGLSKDDLVFIKVLPTTTQILSGQSNQTGGSITSEMCALSVMHACQTLSERLSPYRSEGQSWLQLVQTAASANIDLTAGGWSSSTVSAARYSSWGVAVSEVEVDGLTGQFEVKRTDLVFDCGVSMNPAVDVGQVEGGFVFGLGWMTQEQVWWNASSGRAEHTGTWMYYPPSAYDIPEVFNVSLLENSHNPVGVLSAKACGEPPVALACSVVHALEDAINAVRADSSLPPWSCQSTPLTVDAIATACAISPSAFVFN